ncbi:MAG: ATP-binding protein [Candidatus Omnitrophica bacterium]|nr:ATP-binding protein [Candidatus Omnitrophota bacterium]
MIHFIKRGLEPILQKSKKGVLLLGPRQTGKSTLIHRLSPELSINLALESTYLEFARNPEELTQRLAAKPYKTVFIDEVQRLPTLLNTLQAILDDTPRPPKFYLTGSSARKLKRGKANLLPGRIHTYFLGPLTCAELNYGLNTKQALSTGTLPGIWTETDEAERTKTLRSYAATYLKEEIQAEALTRNLEGFSRFLFVVAAEAGKFLDLSKLGSDAGIPRQSALRYFEILEDTLILKRCDAFRKSQRKRLIQSPRYFFFDTGVLNGLMGNFIVSQDRIGTLFEHLLFNQIIHGAAAKDKEVRISSYRTTHGAEVDFIVELGKEVVAVEAKASTHIGRSDLRGLRSFSEYYSKPHRPVIAYLGTARKVVEKVEVLPWQLLLRNLGL